MRCKECDRPASVAITAADSNVEEFYCLPCFMIATGMEPK